MTGVAFAEGLAEGLCRGSLPRVFAEGLASGLAFGLAFGFAFGLCHTSLTEAVSTSCLRFLSAALLLSLVTETETVLIVLTCFRT